MKESMNSMNVNIVPIITSKIHKTMLNKEKKLVNLSQMKEIIYDTSPK